MSFFLWWMKLLFEMNDKFEEDNKDTSFFSSLGSFVLLPFLCIFFSNDLMFSSFGGFYLCLENDNNEFFSFIWMNCSKKTTNVQFFLLSYKGGIFLEEWRFEEHHKGTSFLSSNFCQIFSSSTRYNFFSGRWMICLKNTTKVGFF